jgi:hypothetical protein
MVLGVKTVLLDIFVRMACSWLVQKMSGQLVKNE